MKHSLRGVERSLWAGEESKASLAGERRAIKAKHRLLAGDEGNAKPSLWALEREAMRSIGLEMGAR